MTRLWALGFAVLAGWLGTAGCLADEGTVFSPGETNRPGLPAADDTDVATRVAELLRTAREREIAGDLPGREEALAEAERIGGTDLPELNWMRGRVFRDGRWQSPEELAAARKTVRALEEYRSMRDASAADFDGQLALARWCDANGLIAQRDAHLKQALTFDPENDQIRRLLFHVNIDGQWYTPEQIASGRADTERASRQFAEWADEVGAIARLFDSPARKRRDEGLRRLSDLDDPASVVAMEQLLCGMNEAVAREATRKIATFPDSDASAALLRIAVFNPWESVRELAMDQLSARDRYDYVPTLIAQLATPVSSEFMLVPTGNSQLLHRHVFFQKTMETDRVRQYDNQYAPVNPLAGTTPEASLQAMAIAARTMEQMERAREQYNRAVEQRNQQIMYLLRRTTGESLNDPESWWRWWYDENEVYVRDRPVSYRRVQNNFPIDSPRSFPVSSGLRSFECLGAGTPVWTDRGPVAVETIRTGDQVLCRDPQSGQLDFRSVVRPTVRPTSPTYRLLLDGESIIASGGHPFHVPGKGWTRVRDLQPGMFLSTLDGITEIRAVDPDGDQELYNLVVDGVPTYFAGQSRILSHDNTIPTRASAASAATSR